MRVQHLLCLLVAALSLGACATGADVAKSIERNPPKTCIISSTIELNTVASAVANIDWWRGGCIFSFKHNFAETEEEIDKRVLECVKYAAAITPGIGSEMFGQILDKSIFDIASASAAEAIRRGGHVSNDTIAIAIINAILYGGRSGANTSADNLIRNTAQCADDTGEYWTAPIMANSIS